MSYLPIAADLAVHATRRQLDGDKADPAGPPTTRPRAAWVRGVLAAALHRLAEALETPKQPTARGQASG
jgi:hypothetical protein